MKRRLLFLYFFSISVLADSALVIESYHSEYAWDKSYLKGITSTLNGRVDIDTFQMNTKRLPESEYELMADRAYEHYLRVNPELVILGDDNAFRLMYPRLYNEPVSIVFLGINSNPRTLLNQYKGQASITGVLEQPLFVKTMAEIGGLLNDGNKKVRIMFDSGVTSKIAIEFMKSHAQSISKNLDIEIEVLAIATQSEWQDAINSAPEEGVSAIIVGLYHTIVDSNGANVAADQIVNWTNHNSKVPLFGFWDFSIGPGKAAGGVVLFGELQGKQAAELVIRILDGESADSIPIQVGRQGKAIYSIEEMKRWKIAPPKNWHPM
ncbi:ABC transporter substrate binding protein [uncultured Vibrio sp.]|uniref:ABC transporter substrate-binding protein n=1 Tax=uncultured Vibrio sp. TaxID=114054 RepID=UPI0025F5C326|nr:ABC transporter substrate binding protein [uncultured Vibrio sp.]